MASEATPAQSPAMRCTYGLPAERIAQLTGVDVSTARRWKSGKSRIPDAARMVLEADLGIFSRAARGWRIEGEEMVTPEGWRVKLNDVRALPLMERQIATLQAENKELKAALEFKAANEPELDLIEVRA